VRLSTNIIKFSLPWAVYFFLNECLKLSANLSSIVCILIVVVTGYKYLRKGFIFNWALLISWILSAVLPEFLNYKYITNDAWLYSNILMAMISWASIFMGKPFALQYAREEVEKNKWEHPLFIKVNVRITAMWGLVFSLCAFFHVLLINNLYDKNLITVGIFISVLFGIVFTARYPKYIRNKTKLTKIRGN